MKLEFRIPISSNPAFYSQVRLIAQSLARLGPPYSEAKIQVSVGDRPAVAEVLTANGWSKNFPVEWYVVPDEICDRLPGPWWISGMGRFITPSAADVIIFLDADTCPIARFDELLDKLQMSGPTLAALQAHRSPFDFKENDASWRGLLSAIGRPKLQFSTPYSIDIAQEMGLSPPYFNYGFVAFNLAAFQGIAGTAEESLRTTCELLPQNQFAAQIALTLAQIQNNVETFSLGHEYNCANTDQLIKHNLVIQDDIRIIHYQRREEFDRQEFLCKREKFDAFVGTEKRNPITERLRAHILSIPDAFIEWT